MLEALRDKNMMLTVERIKGRSNSPSVAEGHGGDRVESARGVGRETRRYHIGNVKRISYLKIISIFLTYK